MPKPENTDLIVGSGVVVTGTTIVKNIIQAKAAKATKTKKRPVVAPIIFGAILTAALLAISLVAPGFSKGLAWLMIIGAFFVNGPAIFKILGGFKA